MNRRAILGVVLAVCILLGFAGVSRLQRSIDAQRRSVQERAGSDPMVEAFRRRFDCTLVDFQDLSGE